MINQASSGFDQTLLQARQRPVRDPLRQCQPPPKVLSLMPPIQYFFRFT
jgi:hypothetical protein